MLFVGYSWSSVQPRKPRIFCPTKITRYTVYYPSACEREAFNIATYA